MSYSAGRTDKEKQVVGSILGTRVLRVEDPRFITTGGRYVDDLRIDGDVPFAGAAVAHYVRSAVAHGTITAIDTDEAKSMPGVIAVYTAADLGLEPVPARFNPTVARPLLATDRVRFVGEPIAVIVAATAAAAADAADAVIVDYEVLDGYVDPLAAIDGDTLLFDAVGSNVVARQHGDGDARADQQRRLLRRLRGRRRPATSSTNGWRRARWKRRSAAAAWVDDRLVRVDVDAARPRRPRLHRPGQRPRRVGGAGRHARRRRRVRRQDHAVSRRSCCSVAWPRSSAGRWRGRRRAASR